MKKQLIILLLLLSGANTDAQIDQSILNDIEDIESQVIDWRHYFHENPELSNREFNTADKIAAHLKSLGMEVQTGVAKTGVVGLPEGHTEPQKPHPPQMPGSTDMMSPDVCMAPAGPAVELYCFWTCFGTIS